MGSLFGEAAAAYYPDAAEEEEEDPFLFNPGDVPYAAPVFGPPAPTGGINPTQGGFRDPVSNPANVTPGPNADFLAPLANAYNTEVPYWTDFARDYAVPAVGAALNAMNPLSGPVNDLLGFDTGEFGANVIVPQTVGDFAVNAVTGGGLTGFDDLARMGSTALGGVDNAVRFASPEPQLFPGYGSAPTPNQWDESVLGPLPSGPEPPREWYTNPGQQAYDAAYQATPGPREDKLLNAEAARQEVLSGEPLPGNFSAIPVDVDGVPTMPNRLGPPLAYDEAFNPPPGALQADAAMREAGVAPMSTPMSNVDDTADQMRNAFEESRRQESILTGGGSTPNPPSVEPAALGSPPPASLTPEEIASTMRQADIDAGFAPLDSPAAEQALGRSLTPVEVDRLNRATNPLDAVPAFSPEGRALRSGEVTAQAPTRQEAILDNVAETRKLLNDRITDQETRFREGNGRAMTASERKAMVEAERAGIGTELLYPDTEYGPMSIKDRILDAAYAPFAGDLSFALRQDATNTLNPFKWQETRRVAGIAAEASKSSEAYRTVMDDLKSMPQTNGMNVQIHFASDTGKLADREGMFSKWMNNVPVFGNMTRANNAYINARRAIEVETFIDKGNGLVRPEQAQTFANYVERKTGRGSFGEFEKAGQKLGPLFTSLRFAASFPERAAYLLPWTRLADGSWEVGGPVWREAVKDHAAFISVVGTTMLAAQQAGLPVDWKKQEITIGNTHVQLSGGWTAYTNLIHQLVTGEKNGKDFPSVLRGGGEKPYKGAVAEFTRNRLGPVPGAVFAASKASGVDTALGVEKEFEFLRPNFWDKGVLGIDGKTGTRLDKLAQFVVPLWMQDVAEAVRSTEGSTLERGLAGAGVAAATVLGLGANTYENRSNPRTAALNPLVSDPLATKDLPPAIQEFLSGKTWNDATAKEQAAIRANMTPEQQQDLSKAEQELRDRKDVFQLNRDDKAERERVANENRAALKPIVDERLYQEWLKGDVRSPREIADKLKELEKRADAEAWTTTNMGPKLSESKAYVDAVKNLPANERQAEQVYQYAATYREIYNNPAVIRPDGTRDYERMEQLQNRFWELLRKDDPKLAERVQFNVQPNPANNFAFTNLINSLDDRIYGQFKYNDIPDGQKTQTRRDTPELDALMALRFGGPVRSRAAGELLFKWAPDRKQEYAK